MTIGKLAESGPDFEKRALALARAIHDPSGQQGAVMIDGQERDGIFIDSRSVVAFEFTMWRTKDKAEKDGQKLRDVLKRLSAVPEHRHKLFQGFFVTMDEPTADQRDVITSIARKQGMSIAAISYITLRRQLIDTEAYLSLRSNAPFGSTAYKLPGSSTQKDLRYVDPVFLPTSGGSKSDINGLESLIASGFRFVLTGDFGAGKSEALHQLYIRGRRKYFKKPDATRFPLHINLRDCYGLRTPSEILRRHAEEIGFADERSLVAAWRAGACDLLLDGFDELVPSRWVGGARDLTQVRWSALEPVRRIVDETPETSGVIVSGRAQFFSNEDELRRCVGIQAGATFAISDFDTVRVNDYLGISHALPEWVPTRPLLLKFLAQNGLLTGADSAADPASSWLEMLEAIATRESNRITSVTPERTLALLARIATTARTELNAGTISTDEMRRVFREVCGYEADEEGLQLLLRLPGLAAAEGVDGTVEAESRRFVDQSLSDVSQGVDLATYISAPFVNHPLSEAVVWSQASNPLTWQVAAARLESQSFDSGVVSASVRNRMGKQLFDCILVDCSQVGLMMGTRLPREVAPFFSEVLIADLSLRGTDLALEVEATYKDCLIDHLDVSEIEDASRLPTFQSCLIGEIDGRSQIPKSFEANFAGCETGHFSSVSMTTSGLLGLDLSPENRVALVILKKIYAQAGSGRKESALARGLPLQDRGLVGGVIRDLASAGYTVTATGRGEVLVLPVRDRRGAVRDILANPSAFRLANL